MQAYYNFLIFTIMNRKEIIISELINNPHDPFNLYLLALEHLKDNNREEAMKIFNRIYDTSPNYLPLYYIYAINLIEVGNLEKAKAIVLSGVEIAKLTNKGKVIIELNQLLELYFD